MTGRGIAFAGEPGAKARQFAELLREAVRRVPGDLRCRQSLARALFDLGDAREAAAVADEALALFPGDVELGTLRVTASLKLGDLDAALMGARILHRAAPQDAGAGQALLDALKAAGRRDERAQAAAGMDWLASNPRYRLGVLAPQVEQGRATPDALLACADAVLAGHPGHTHATYYRAVALARLARDAEARETLGLDRYLSVADLPGIDRAALAAEIRANPTLTPDPGLNATAGGLQTLQLRQPGERAVAALVRAIEDAVQAYAAALPEGDFAAAMPAHARLHSWAVICGPEGRQSPHLHPGGWLSGVYYVEAPEVDGRYRGALRIGPAGGIESPPWGISEIEPVPGRVVLFPSYTPHATEPSGVSGDRIIVAFDVVPA